MVHVSLQYQGKLFIVSIHPTHGLGWKHYKSYSGFEKLFFGRARWNAVESKYLNCLVSTNFGSDLGMPTFRQIGLFRLYTKLWSLIPMCITPESMIFISPSLVIITLINILVVGVILVGLINECAALIDIHLLTLTNF